MESKTTIRKGKLKRGIDAMNPWEQIVERGLSSQAYSARNRIFASNSALCERQTSGFLKLPEDHLIKRKASTQFYFGIGSLFESVMMRAFQKKGVYITDELRVETLHPELEISGRIDFVLKDKKSKKPIIMELKSCGKLPTSPKAHHLAQLHAYMLFTGQKRALLWYVSRNVSDFSGDLKQRVFEIELSEDQARSVALRIALGSVYAESPFLPDKPEHMKKWKCGFCPLIPFCWDNEDLDLSYEEHDEDDELMLLKQAETIAEELIESQSDLEQYFLHLIKTATK